MDIGIDQGGWGKDPSPRRDGEPRRPDWHGLIARLSAARAARRVLSREVAASAADAAAMGSFDRDSARVLSEYEAPLSDVNPVFWANGKLARIMDSPVAGKTGPGVREC